MYPWRMEDQKGSAIIEMACFLVAFSFLVIAILDFGSAINAALELSTALRAGLQVATKRPGDTNAIIYAVRNASSLPMPDVRATADRFCECNGANALCSSTCSGALSVFVNITATYPVPLLLNSAFIPNPYPLKKAVAVRVQ
jgi:Flp pilus assembly protein TadG